jgi:hypothetical protein
MAGTRKSVTNDESLFDQVSELEADIAKLDLESLFTEIASVEGKPDSIESLTMNVDKISNLIKCFLKSISFGEGLNPFQQQLISKFITDIISLIEPINNVNFADIINDNEENRLDLLSILNKLTPSLGLLWAILSKIINYNEELTLNSSNKLKRLVNANRRHIEENRDLLIGKTKLSNMNINKNTEYSNFTIIAAFTLTALTAGLFLLTVGLIMALKTKLEENKENKSKSQIVRPSTTGIFGGNRNSNNITDQKLSIPNSSRTRP